MKIILIAFLFFSFSVFAFDCKKQEQEYAVLSFKKKEVEQRAFTKGLKILAEDEKIIALYNIALANYKKAHAELEKKLLTKWKETPEEKKVFNKLEKARMKYKKVSFDYDLAYIEGREAFEKWSRTPTTKKFLAKHYKPWMEDRISFDRYITVLLDKWKVTLERKKALIKSNENYTKKEKAYSEYETILSQLGQIPELKPVFLEYSKALDRKNKILFQYGRVLSKWRETQELRSALVKKNKVLAEYEKALFEVIPASDEYDISFFAGHKCWIKSKALLYLTGISLILNIANITFMLI